MSVAAAVSTLLTLLYFLVRSGLLGAPADPRTSSLRPMRKGGGIRSEGGPDAGQRGTLEHMGAGPGTLEAIWIKRMRGGPMDPVDAAELERGRGLVANANRGGRRQVTILSRERWTTVQQVLGVQLDPATRRANLLVSGIDLARSRGRVLTIAGTRLRINGETRPCWQMEEAHPGLQAALDPQWGGGAFAEVLDGGVIRIGDVVRWEESVPDP